LLGPRNRLSGITSGTLFFIFSTQSISQLFSAEAAQRPATIGTIVADPFRPVLAPVWVPGEPLHRDKVLAVGGVKSLG
jgi:hypothetical protein